MSLWYISPRRRAPRAVFGIDVETAVPGTGFVCHAERCPPHGVLAGTQHLVFLVRRGVFHQEEIRVLHLGHVSGVAFLGSSDTFWVQHAKIDVARAPGMIGFKGVMSRCEIYSVLYTTGEINEAGPR